jgi:FkbM family methyltransferase
MRAFTVDQETALGTLALRGIELAEVVTRPLQHRGLFKLARWCGRLAPEDQRCTVELEEDARFVFRTRDPYWNRLISERFHYEEDLERVLKGLADIDYWFIDAGANYGYWSALVSSRPYGAKPAIAIEPVSGTFRALEENCAANGRRFIALRMAVADESGRQVVIHYPRRATRGANAAASMIANGHAEEDVVRETVDSISIDAAIDRHAPPGAPIVLKLDIEGMEVPALRAATALGRRDWLLIYEDHGNDAECRTSQFVMTLDVPIFLVTLRGEVRRVESIDHVREVKTQERQGYNFFAVSRGGVFERRLAELAA